MSVRIRLKKMGRRHRPFFRVCAMDIRSPRDGRVIEELGTYDPMISETDARADLKRDRVDYWLNVGAQPSEKASVLIKKYGPNGTHLEEQEKAFQRLAQQRRRPEVIDAPQAPPKTEKKEEQPAAEEAASPKPEKPPQETKAEAPAEEAAPKAEEASADAEPKPEAAEAPQETAAEEKQEG